MLIVYESNDDDLPRSKYQEYRFSPLFLAMLYPRARLRVVEQGVDQGVCQFEVFGAQLFRISRLLFASPVLRLLVLPVCAYRLHLFVVLAPARHHDHPKEHSHFP